MIYKYVHVINAKNVQNYMEAYTSVPYMQNKICDKYAWIYMYFV